MFAVLPGSVWMCAICVSNYFLQKVSRLYLTSNHVAKRFQYLMCNPPKQDFSVTFMLQKHSQKGLGNFYMQHNIGIKSASVLTFIESNSEKYYIIELQFTLSAFKVPIENDRK